MTQPGDKRFRYLRDDDITDRSALEWYLDGIELDIGNYGVEHVDSAVRPPFPETGKMIFETDTGRQRVWDGTYWVELFGPAYSWTPVWASQFTAGNATYQAQYSLRGWEMHWVMAVTLGSTSTMGTNPKLNTPSTFTVDNSSGAAHQLAHALAIDATGPTYYAGTAGIFDASDNRLSTRVVFNTATITATAPFTWATGDQLILQGVTLMSDLAYPTS